MFLYDNIKCIIIELILIAQNAGIAKDLINSNPLDGTAKNIKTRGLFDVRF